MPRVRVSAANPSYAESPVKKVQIPLNDDGQEKAARLQSRKLLANKQLDQLKAAATPQRGGKRKSLGAGDDPHTPSQDEAAAGHFDVAGNGLTPMKRVPLLANFEEWMKMATDNKINAANSWNFALIDYFHDMSLLREGDGVNFQKASCTLDGCVKIYTSRVDSVATETGKLLSGLADTGGGKKRKGEEGGAGEDGEEDEEDGEGEGGKKKTRKKANRSAEATLATSFEQLRLKKMELEFSVDPLFKKAAADFDEGGAKGLLMNHLSIDGTGRIVFDSSDDVQEGSDEAERRDSMEPDGEQVEKESEEPVQPPDGPIDMAGLAARFFPDLDRLDEQEICPSLKTFELGAGEGSLDLPFLKAPDNWRDEHPEGLTTHHEDNLDDPNALPNDAPAFDVDSDDDDAAAGAADLDLPPSTGFGEGGEAWARDAALHPQMRVHDLQQRENDSDGDNGGEVGTFDTNSAAYGVTLQHRSDKDHQEANILNYFDATLHSNSNKNWAGPEHWKIARIKENTKAGASGEKKVRKEKEPFEIDFAAPMTGELAAQLYTKASSNAAISLPRAQWRSKTRNLLPDDKHFNSKDLLGLFLKPKARLGSRKIGGGKGMADGEHVDEAYWATAAHHTGGAAGEQGLAGARHPMDDDDEAAVNQGGGYDADFFQDDNLPLPGGADMADEVDEEFADAAEYVSPAADDMDAAAGDGGSAGHGPDGAGIDDVPLSSQPDGGMGLGADAFGAQLVTQSRRVRPEYVQYARTAKKVDVRRLKENMWRGIGFEDKPNPQIQTPARSHVTALPKDESGSLMFTSIMNNLQSVYPRQAMADISTSYGFICLLHLANEKGLVVENVDGLGDLRVRKDAEAVDLEGGGD
ncbi:hypothetical protein LTR57_012928 [Friedmanniomyces endolithicus]|nr:hypothetical protein LTR75_000311 [Friedmanniomyces endolithicus]KAK0882114.1 hypothetical protein LTR87_004069 [Friedmanniomyces endolithicus]KAK0916476.1 hypothetical protein LTR57_012928 [Friedmanniomyces endolithicus]KAK1074751.1 hypothetical protein LTR33_009701 [Friedmanniomyces endolithicus]